MPENENTLNDELSQAMKSLDGEVVVTEPVAEEVVEEVKEPTVTEETQEPVEQEEKEELDNEAEKLPHGESSRLGRKVKRMEDTFAEALAKIEALTNAIGQSNISRPVEQTPNVDDEMPEIITTPEDVQKVIDIRDRQKTMAAQKEKTAYFGRFESHKSEDPDLYDEVYEEMLKNYNVKITGKPEIDADLNYLKAKNAVFSRKLTAVSKPKPNSLGKTPPPANVPSSSPVSSKVVNLTPAEQEAANVFGFNEEELQRIFSK